MLITALALMAFAPQTFTLQPTDDLWVYPHSTDPGGDATMRIWGFDGRGAPATSADAGDYGMGYLKWTLVGTPVGGKLIEAKLVLNNAAKAAFTLDQAKATPLEARLIAATFDERTFKVDAADMLIPKAGKDDVYGTGAPEALGGATVTITIDLLKGKGGFAEAVTKAQKDGKKDIAIALTSALNMAELGGGVMYKVYTKDEKDEALRPKLVLVFE